MRSKVVSTGFVQECLWREKGRALINVCLIKTSKNVLYT